MTIGEHKVLQNIFGAWRTQSRLQGRKYFAKKKKKIPSDNVDAV